MHKPEIHKVFEETQFRDSQREIPLDKNDGSGKPHRFTFNIGCFNDGLRSSFCNFTLLGLNFIGFRRILTDFDETVFGIQKNQMG